MIRTRKFLEDRKLWDNDQQARAEERHTIVQEVMKIALEAPSPAITDIFDSVFANLPDSLRKQRDTLRTDSIGQDPEQIGLKRASEPSPL